MFYRFVGCFPHKYIYPQKLTHVYPCNLTSYGPSPQPFLKFKMSESLRDVNHIAKFNGRNFSLWKFGCWLLLEQYNLVKIVNGEEVVSLPVYKFFFFLHTGANVNLYLFTKDRDNNVVRNAAAIADWHKRDLLARNYLIATLENQQQRVLVNCANFYLKPFIESSL